MITPLDSHIQTYDEALSPSHCDKLIALFESSPDKELCRREAGHSFAQLDLTQHRPDEHTNLIPIFHAHFGRYQKTVNAKFWPPRSAYEHLRLKRYLPNGRDHFPEHVDVMTHAAARRFMTAIVYLNSPQGGETVFPGFDITIKPERGKLLAFPPLWPFPHAGLPPKAGPKYILHTYLCYPPDIAG